MLIKQEIEEIEKCVPLSTIRSIDMAIRESVCDCLEKSDFNFVSFKDDPKGLKNVAGEYIESIKKKLYGMEEKATKNNFSKEEDKIFNSQSFNFGCSEQLLPDYIFSRQIKRAVLSKRIKEAIQDKKATCLFLQIDTTKMPCAACVIDIMLNIKNGDIFSFFDSLEEIKDKKVVVTYSEAYDGEYFFKILPFSQYKEGIYSSLEMFLVPNKNPVLSKFQKLTKELDEIKKNMKIMQISENDKISFVEIIKYICDTYNSKTPDKTAVILTKYAQDQAFVDFILGKISDNTKKKEIELFMKNLTSGKKEKNNNNFGKIISILSECVNKEIK